MHPEINTAIEKVRNTFPSIYSQDDVITLLEQLDRAMDRSDDPFDLKKYTEQVGTDVVKALMMNCSRAQLIDLESADFSIGARNQLVLESVELHESNIEYLVLETMEKTYREFTGR